MSNFTFGAPTTTSTSNLTFNTPTLSTGFGGTAAPTFGSLANQGQATPSLNFNLGSNNATAQPQTGISFGTLGGGSLAAPAANTGLSFGTPAKAAAVAPLSFGTPATTSSLSFGAPATTGGLTFGTSTSTPSLGFGAPATTANITFSTPATTSGLSFGAPTSATTGISFGAPASTTGISFGATNTVPLSSNLSFGNTQTTTTSSLFGSTTGSLFGAKPIAAAAPVLAAPTTTAATTINKGLGGSDVSVTNKGLSQGRSSPTAAKENLLPNELMVTIDGFKEFVKSQKSLSSDIARGSSRPLTRCAEDTASLMEILTTLAGNVQRDRQLADRLKQDTAKALQNAEIAQRTHDIPSGLQYENNAPLLFFIELADSFENDLLLFKNQIEVAEKHIQTMVTPKALTPQELTTAMNKLHESLVAVAGKLQGIHTKVQQQKEQYLNFRKYVLKDTSNVFDDAKLSGKLSRINPGKISSGPTPFGPGNKSFLNSTNFNASQAPSYTAQNPLAWGTGSTTNSSNFLLDSSMKPPTTGLNFNPPTNPTAPLSSTYTNSSFQLQKPPVGNKRGKH